MRLELLTTAQMAEADRLAIAAGTSGAALMQAAGDAVAHRAAAMLEARGRRAALVLCGPGANGGDGYVAARRLLELGFAVRVAALGDPARLRGDALAAAQRWTGPVEDARAADCVDADLVVDALFGAGLSRDLDGDARALVERLNAWRAQGRCATLAVDTPSGLDGSTGMVRGVAVAADETITFFRLKPGHLLLPGRILCGATACADIGIQRDVLARIAPATFRNEPELWRGALPVPGIAGHKYARGHALVVSGPASFTGAARLAARGALRAGAGLVTVASPADALPENAAALTAVMVRRSDGPAGLAALLADPRRNAVALGPGLGVGEPTCALVETALTAEGEARAVVLDADAITSFAAAPERLFRAIASARGPVLLTPHAGEFARLFGRCGDGKLAAARAAAADAGAVIVLKGADTVVAAPDGRATIADNAPPWLATAGSGDVLAGMACGLLAAHMPAWDAACAAVWMHGAAGAAFGPGLIAEDLPEALPKVWRSLLEASRPTAPEMDAGNVSVRSESV